MAARTPNLDAMTPPVYLRPVLLSCVALPMLLLVLQFAPAGAVEGGDPDLGSWNWPFQPTPRVVADFEAPESDYGPGHRGVDLAGAVSQSVFAVAAGEVTFAGEIAGRGVIVVDHGELRSTYQPVAAQLAKGDQVEAGDRLATLTADASHCAPRACLHLGARRGDEYVDPLLLLGGQGVRLKPLDETSVVDKETTGPRSPARSATPGSTEGDLRERAPYAVAVAGGVALLAGARYRHRQARG